MTERTIGHGVPGGEPARGAEHLVVTRHRNTATYVAFDLETTGLNPWVDRVVEVGALAFDAEGRELGRFESLVNPGRPVPAAARAVHGLDDATLATAPNATEVLPRFLEWLRGLVTFETMAHHASFDTSFLGHELARIGHAGPELKVIDTVAVARRAWPRLPNHRLDTVATLLGLPLDDHHRALGDSRRVQGLWLAAVGAHARQSPEIAHVSMEPLVRYAIAQPTEAPRLPLGFEWVIEAIKHEACTTIEYAGGTRGVAPRRITPREVVRRGGTLYLNALCHADGVEKQFRFDRILRASPVGLEGVARPG